ncbi:MAG: hypothetical protein ACOCRN_04810, partial [Spirochaetia bacterium]
LLVGLALLVAGCSDSSFFLPEEAIEGDISVSTIDDGAFLSSEDTISFEIEVGERTEFDGATITVEDRDGNTVDEFERSRDDFGADMVVDVPVSGLEEGVYSFEIRVFDARGESVLSERRQAFVVDGDYRLSGVSSYPARVHPGARAILRTSVDGPDNAWLQWSVDGEVLASGPASGGFEEFEWQTPDAEGVYRVRVDLYPVGAEGDDPFEFSSSMYETADVYVSANDSENAASLGPAESYYSLFPLRGDFRDIGVRSNSDSGETGGEALGSPELRVENDLFGYYLDGNSGFSAPGLAVPFIDNSLAPFSLNMVLLADGTQESRTLFRTESADDSFEFVLETDSSGVPQVRMRNGENEARSSMQYAVFDEREPVSLSVSLSPGTDYTTVMWFVDGRPSSIERLDVGFPSSPLGDSPTEAARTRVVDDTDGLSFQEGRTVVGAQSDGFVGLVDEVGVYFRDDQDRLSVDDGLFRDAMESHFASRLAYAQGFEGLFMPEELRSVGRVTVRSGELVLEPGAEVYFPAFLFEDEDLIVELELGENAERALGEFVFREARTSSDSAEVWDSGESVGSEESRDGATSGNAEASGEADGVSGGAALLTAASDGSVVFGDQFSQERFSADGGSTLLLRFRHEGDRMRVRGGGGDEYEFELSESRFDGITMTANHPEDREVPFRVLSVLAHRDRTDLSERLDFSQER